MAKPWRWQSDQLDGWYYEKQENSNTWIEYKNNTVWTNFTLIFSDTDYDGLPVVVLRKHESYINSIIKLTEGIAYWDKTQLTEQFKINQNEFKYGHWVKKTSSYFRRKIYNLYRNIRIVMNSYSHYFKVF